MTLGPGIWYRGGCDQKRLVLTILVHSASQVGDFFPSPFYYHAFKMETNWGSESGIFGQLATCVWCSCANSKSDQTWIPFSLGLILESPGLCCVHGSECVQGGTKSQKRPN